jgi:ABC-2 type transport system ATP-binding protein
VVRDPAIPRGGTSLARDPSDPVLRLDGLCKSFGGLQAVSDLSAAVLPGEVFGLLGPNGAGKTTTIRMVCGELRPDAGRVFLHGRELSRTDADRARVGVCPQELVVWDKLTCREQLAFVAGMYGVPGREARVRTDELLDELGLAEKAQARAAALSGGQRRRLNIALALVHSPELVILDEPSAGLDPQSRALVRNVIRSRARSCTVLLTTHDMDEADRLSDRVAIVDRGRLLVCDTPAKLRHGQGGPVIELRFVTGGEEAAAEALRGSGSPGAWTDVQVTPGLVVVRSGSEEPSETLRDVLSALDSRGIRPNEVRLREPSLEDVFLALTGRSLR